MTGVTVVQGVPFLACLVMLLVLGYIGIHVLKREVIFIDIALAQIAAVGTIAAHVVFHMHGDSVYAHIMAFGGTLLAAGFFAFARRRIIQIPLEAVIGVSYATAAAAALFLVGVAPGGHVHIQEMLAGSILWATWNDLAWMASVFGAAGVCFVVFRRHFRAISDDYAGAAVAGINTAWWDFLFYALVGVVITMAVRTAGVVLVFAFLIIPATLSASFASGWTGRLVAAWVAGAASAVLGLLFAERFDFSVGPAIALFLGASLILTAALRRAGVARIPAAAVWLAGVVVFGGWFASGASVEVTAGSGAAPDLGSITHTHADAGDLHDDEGVPFDRERIASLTDMDSLRAAYAAAGDADERSTVVCRALDARGPGAVEMALDFLSHDPPLLFRALVTASLDEATGGETGYDAEQPYSAPHNREAVLRLRDRLHLPPP